MLVVIVIRGILGTIAMFLIVSLEEHVTSYIVTRTVHPVRPVIGALRFHTLITANSRYGITFIQHFPVGFYNLIIPFYFYDTYESVHQQYVRHVLRLRVYDNQ